MNKSLFHSLLLALLLTFSTLAVKAEQTYSIYLDADFDSAAASSIAIAQGINTALAEVNYQVQGHTFNVVSKNHSRSPLQSRDNLNSYLNDSNAIAVFTGIHSPPILSNQSFINRNKILMLDPWAADMAITRSQSQQNWIFRLSIDDSNASQYLTESMINKGFSKPYLLLEDTKWGRSNYANISKVLQRKSIKAAGVSWFNWDTPLNQAKGIVSTITLANPDSIIYIGNAIEAKTFAQATLAIKSDFQFPIFSHWGITGGDFFEYMQQVKQQEVDLTFIQTKFSFTSKPVSPFAQQVLASAIKHNETINSASDIKAPTGFIHAYDLTKIFIAAINQAGLSGDRDKDKQAIHRALEHLAKPVQGLIKTYHQPFSPYSATNPNGHEALNINDYSLGRYKRNGEIELIK